MINQDKPKKVPIPNNSVDKGIIYFTIHEDGTEWIVKELHRVLKPHGRGFITDLMQINKELTLFEEAFLDMIPFHSKMGIIESEILKMMS